MVDGGNEVAFSGKYQISNCGDTAVKVQELLEHIDPMLQAVLRDLDTGIASNHGYSAIFRDHTVLPFVRQQFQDIASANPRPVETNQSIEVRSPILVCVPPNDPAPDTSQFKSHCVDSPAHTPATYISKSPYIVLCPKFFDMKPMPEGSDCPSTTQKNTFRGPHLFANQYGALIRQFARFQLGPLDLAPEVVDPNEMVKLTAERARRNAKSYALYAASKMPIPCSVVLFTDRSLPCRRAGRMYKLAGQVTSSTG